MTQPLWQPTPERKEGANISAFMEQLKRDWGVELSDYAELYDWSVKEIEKFWSSVWTFGKVVAETRGDRILVDGTKMPGAAFFPDARLNFAQNLLRRRGPEDAIVFWGEDKVKRRLSHDALNALVSRLQQRLQDLGVGEGDRVAGFMPNMPETVAAMLATASLGAVWSSCSPDFGVQGVLDRFGQIEPKVLFCPDGYYYNGKAVDSLARVAEFSKEIPSLNGIIVCPYLNDEPDVSTIAKAMTLTQAISGKTANPIQYRHVAFNAPLYIMFSSGTTGKPKCIVHGVGGTLLQHIKEHKLQCDVKPGDRVFYFTTCGWMMWNWLVSGLAAEATLLLYDGSPFHPVPEILFDYMDAERGTLFGTSAKFIDSLKNAGADPKSSHDLSSIRIIASTGSPLVAEGFDYVYAHIKEDVCLASIAGGTDIISCFVAGNPIGAVWRGEIQARCLGMAVEVFDDEGQPTRGKKGELVCTRPFPSMPIYFWNDPDGARYHSAYFERYDNIWCQGDFAEITEHDGVIIYGRSDATLNPGGVRIGTAEIYRQVEKLPEIDESLVIGQDWQGDVRVVLFVRLAAGAVLDEDLIKRIKTQVRTGATPRHVPAKVVAVADIPRTKSGKIVELAVRDVVHGRAVKNKDALANPEALDLYVGLAELQE
ncbi:acetoacetate--CoA ligase [Limibacillus halophilus]|uniref:Acetoacetyl-CoA synthetase n=1 Tax=Limibacillus halophilus TaxID=1579333 RepID=A0A839SV13_9PROT|nr:acetoacetate--CoA ligase [Limibacillus halophilus]MBB3065286.1 acetoacetyl-CoA synthetase [Limibacillus halophilus]